MPNHVSPTCLHQSIDQRRRFGVGFPPSLDMPVTNGSTSKPQRAARHRHLSQIEGRTRAPGPASHHHAADLGLAKEGDIFGQPGLGQKSGRAPLGRPGKKPQPFLSIGVRLFHLDKSKPYYTTRHIIHEPPGKTREFFMTAAPQRTPVWRSIAESLRRSIADGHYEEGSKLPTEAVLAERFGVNRHTVRHAISFLADEGLVHSRRGSGVFVLSRPLDYPLSERVRFHQNLLAAGRLPEKRILTVELRSAGEDDARRLRVAQGELIAVSHSLSFADGTPVALAESRFPETRLPGLAEALREESSITRALEKAGVRDYTRVSTRLTATTANATQALHLRLREGAPLLLTESLSRDQDGWPVEHGQTWFASERITITLEHADT